MKLFFYFLVSIVFTLLSFQTKSQTNIGNCSIAIDTIKGNYEFEENDSLIIKINNTNSSFLLYESIGDCSSNIITIGHCTLIKNNLTYYQYFNGEDRMQIISQYGGLKKNFVLDTNHCKLKLDSSFIYLYQDPIIEGEGSKYLYKSVKNKDEEKLLQDYVSLIEKKYNSTFVYGTIADNLINEIKLSMKYIIDEKFIPIDYKNTFEALLKTKISTGNW